MNHDQMNQQAGEYVRRGRNLSTADLAYVTPSVMKWARERAGLTHQKVAKLVKKSTPSLIQAWEEGRSRPTSTQAQQFASKVRIPFAVLFLPHPPTIEIKLPDLRTATGGPSGKRSLDLLEIVNNAQIRRRWYRDYQEATGGHFLKFVGKYKFGDNSAEIGADIRNLLGINDTFRRQCRDYRQFLGGLIRAVERLGILVMRCGLDLAANEVKGFAISDDLAPLIFINSLDAQAAQIFTVAHELVHIWIGSTGVSNPDLTERPEAIRNEIEAFCNRTAAELLVPESGFAELWDNSKTHLENIWAISAHFKVSRLVVTRRAYELEKLSLAEFYHISKAEYRKAIGLRRRNEARQGQGSFWNVFYARNGRRFIESVLGSVSSSQTSYIEAARLLGVRATVVANLLASTSSGY